MSSIEQLSSAPTFTIRAASERTGVPDVTLRMWERRYGVVQPSRSAGNYRLYSERDIALLRWLKHEVDRGTPIHESAADLKRRLAAGDWPQALPSLRRQRQPAQPAQGYVRGLFDSLAAADERRARALLRQAESQYDLDALCLQILTPCLVEIGEAWHRGQIRVAQEHFASAFLRGHLLSLFQAYPLRRSARRAFVGCAPSEQHEIGALMLALFLRRGGCRVDYLGANVDTSDLLAYTREQRPDLIALSAATDGPALELIRTAAGLARLRHRPLFGFGGRAFNLNPGLRNEIRGHFLGEDAALGAATALRLLKKRS